MPGEKKIYDFPQIYERIDMKLGNFGCIMLNVEPIMISDILDKDREWFYRSTNPLLKYVKGPVAEVKAHATLLYGLTPNENAGLDQKTSVDELLADLDLSEVTVESVGSFPPQFNEPYACVVAHLSADENLAEANRRLRFLPHIDSFVEFRPHVTLAYVLEDHANEAISQLSGAFEDTTLQAIGIDYGGKIE